RKKLKPKKMKKKTLLIALSITLIVISVKSQSWVTQNVNPVDEGYNFICLSVIDSNTAAGVGILVGQSQNQFGYISRTIDGGANWTSNALDTDWYVTSYQALSADTMWISTISYLGIPTTNYRTAISKSTDGGQTWIKNKTIPFDSTSYCDFLHFFNSNDGVAFGDVHNGDWQVYYTMDGGLTWNLADSIPAPLSGEGVIDKSQYVLGDNIWATSSKGRVFFSQDKGHNWQAATVGVFSLPNAINVAFFNLLEGIAVRFNANTNLTGPVYRTHDGGVTWSQVTHTGTFYQGGLVNGLFVVPGSNIVIANGGGSTHYGSAFSADSGATWIDIDATQKYAAIDGKSWNSLWAGQYSHSLGVGGIAKWNGTHLGIKQFLIDADISVYPNPCIGKLNITSSGKITRLEILNPLGQVVYQEKPNEKNVSLQLDVTGIYFVRITIDKQTLTKKLLVLH
ncbi:MAG: T9SS type A sorting domain-containing protein, partial [Bacteroidia bacterium]|nr:T9SS type A sorting domain-containing protein [Bacteroidia bacterium]